MRHAAQTGSARATDARLDALGLLPNKKTVLVVGGGDGVGSLASIVDTTASQLAEDCPGAAQVGSRAPARSAQQPTYAHQRT